MCSSINQSNLYIVSKSKIKKTKTTNIKAVRLTAARQTSVRHTVLHDNFGAKFNVKAIKVSETGHIDQSMNGNVIAQ